VAIPDTLVARHPRAWALWAATRPSQVALIALVYALGLGVGVAGPPFTRGSVPGPASALAAPDVWVGLAALVPTAVAVHYANEYVDAETDARTEPTPFSGGSGALRRTGQPPALLGRATLVATAVAVLVTAGTVAGGWLPGDAAAVLVAILASGLAYSLPPLALVRRGVGEAVNAALGGLLLPLYGVAVVGRPTPLAVLVATPFALVVGCNLLATHWPDREADAAVGKRTLAVRWSPARLRRAYAVLVAAALTVAGWLWVADVVPDAVAAAHLVPVPLLAYGGHVLTRRRSPLPAVAAMVVLAALATAAWWWVALGG